CAAVAPGSAWRHPWNLMPDQSPPLSITYTRRSPHQTLTLAAVLANLRAWTTACPSSRQLGNVISSVHFPSCPINRATYSIIVAVDRGCTRSRQLPGGSRIILKRCFTGRGSRNWSRRCKPSTALVVVSHDQAFLRNAGIGREIALWDRPRQSA